eukprot:TRINITY_DN25432_c1_g1_i1.p1 TRINITY_DN25432_c1_g1~~TRINITY_DN25432_c1_g1_i1.p1  ORF type:complete len:491 (-),score=78.55 TRINITY_DN25432_c1_g1_i1:80-1552(-)
MDNLDAQAVVKAFRTWDRDSSGTIERQELVELLHKVDISECEINEVLRVVDVNRDGKINYEEFVQWVSNPRASVPTLGTDGWFSKFDFSSALVPLFKCFDRNGDSAISAAEFVESYQILVSCLKMHPDCTDADGWARDPNDLLSLIDGNHDSQISFDEFLEWQVDLVRHSRIPTFQLPRLFEELARSLDVILDIDEKVQQNKPRPPGTFAALESSVKRTSITAQRLYGIPSASTCQKSFSTYWASAPSATDVRNLVQLCAKKHGIMLPMCQTQEELMDKGHRLNAFSVAARRQITMAVGRIMLCIPDCTSTTAQQWFVQVVKTRQQGAERSFFYRFTDAGVWQLLVDQDQEQFHAALADLPVAFRLLSLLQGHAYMAPTMHWQVVLEALDRAVKLAILDSAAPKLYEAHMHKLVEQHIQDQIQNGKKTYPSSNTDASIVYFLACLELEPFNVITGLCNCRAFDVPDEVWADLVQLRSSRAESDPLQRNSR